MVPTFLASIFIVPCQKWVRKTDPLLAWYYKYTGQKKLGIMCFLSWYAEGITRDFFIEANSV